MLRKCYQCGGETLGPMVKHLINDSRGPGETEFKLVGNPLSLR